MTRKRTHAAGPTLAALLGILVLTACEPPEPPLPDFSTYQDVNEKKEAFFEYLLPMIRKANDAVWEERQRVQELADRWQNDPVVADSAEWQSLVEAYKVDTALSADQQLTELFSRVDVVPASLVLAQAANESAWAGSRFAREGKNLFGIWCFEPGCGITPANRDPGKTHEVAAFPSVQAGVDYYVRLINTHNAYARLRELRAQAREEGSALTGRALAAGLRNYSERGQDYIDEVRAMIRINKLAQYNLSRTE